MLDSKQYKLANLSETEFHAKSDETLEALYDDLTETNSTTESILDELDVNISQGVLTIVKSSKGTWVINKQTPNRQLWWSSPISGEFSVFSNSFDLSNLHTFQDRSDMITNMKS